MTQQELKKVKQEREKVFSSIVSAFEEKYSWLGLQASRQLLLSAASWNLEQHSNPQMRYRNHVVLAWERGWVKSTMLRKMAGILGDDFCSTMGKVTDAAMRGSTSAGKFMPPKPLKTPIVISTEFGQTDFNDELLNLFLALLEESRTNVALNKLGALSESQKRNIENKHDGAIEFGAENEYDLQCNFVFWGATYDPDKLQDDALRSRFDVVTPSKELDSTITEAMDNNRFYVDKDIQRAARRMLQSDREMRTEFKPPSSLYTKYNLIPRESRDIQAHMACRNWWGLDVNPDIMESYIRHLKQSRRISTMSPKDRIFDLIFDNPMTLDKLSSETRYEKQHIYKILQTLPNVHHYRKDDGLRWVIYSGEEVDELEEEKEESSIENAFSK